MRSIQLLSKRLQLWEVIHLGWLEGSQVDIHRITHTTCVHHCEYPANRNGPLDDSQTYPSLNVQPCDYIESYGKAFPNGNQQLGDFSFNITFITLRNIVKKNWQVLLLCHSVTNNDVPVCFSAALLSFTFFHYACAFAAMVMFYVFYTQPDDCTEHKVFISLNFIFCIIVSVVSILPKVQVELSLS